VVLRPVEDVHIRAQDPTDVSTGGRAAPTAGLRALRTLGVGCVRSVQDADGEPVADAKEFAALAWFDLRGLRQGEDITPATRRMALAALLGDSEGLARRPYTRPGEVTDLYLTCDIQ